MTITDLTSRIEPLFNEMREITLAAGVPESQYEKIREVDPDTITLDELSDRLRFMQAVRAEQYQGVLVIWRLLPAEVWERYKAMGEHNLREQKLLKEARRKLRTIWRSKYGEAKPAAVKEEHPREADGERVRPEGPIASLNRRGDG